MTQNLENSIKVCGIKLELRLIEKGRLKGTIAGARALFNLYEAEFKGNRFVVLKGKSPKRMPPSHMKYFSECIGESLNLPVVFLLEGLKTIERDRLVQKVIHFIVSGKYAFLPFLIVNRLSSNVDTATQLTPAAQYLLLYHLQVNSLNDLTAKDLSALIPYSYIAITRAVKVLIDCGLITIEAEGKYKRIKFTGNRERTWNQCLPLLKSPIKKVCYMEGNLEGEYKICGINALASYTHLNPLPQKMYALTEEEFGDLRGLPMYELEGEIRLEVWTYPAIPVNERAVDPLSLFLTLREDPDPRVEKDLEYLLKELWQKD